MYGDQFHQVLLMSARHEDALSSFKRRHKRIKTSGNISWCRRVCVCLCLGGKGVVGHVCVCVIWGKHVVQFISVIFEESSPSSYLTHFLLFLNFPKCPLISWPRTGVTNMKRRSIVRKVSKIWNKCLLFGKSRKIAEAISDASSHCCGALTAKSKSWRITSTAPAVWTKTQQK